MKTTIEKIDKIVDKFVYWFFVSFTILLTFSVIWFMCYVVWDKNKLLLFFPLLLLIIVRKPLFTYVKGLFTLDSSDFPTTPF